MDSNIKHQINVFKSPIYNRKTVNAVKSQEFKTQKLIKSRKEMIEFEAAFDASVYQMSQYICCGFPFESRDIVCDWNKANNSYTQFSDERFPIYPNIFSDKSNSCEILRSNIENPFNPNEMLEKMRTFSKDYFKESDKSKKETLSKDLLNYLHPLIPVLCLNLNTVLDEHPMIERVQSPAFAFGDIHGNFQDICDYEQMFWKSDKESTKDSNYLFLGDFVDRGSQSVECAVYLFLLKVTQPLKFFLIRGNHEIRAVNKSYTFLKECKTKFGAEDGNKVWDCINQSFEMLPIAAIIDKTVFCCHGGVPKSMTSVTDILKIKRPLVDPESESPAAHELMWNDPVESMTTYSLSSGAQIRDKGTKFIANRARSTGFYFTELAVDEFFESNELSFMIRAHESVIQGYRSHFGGKVMTVFSSSNYCGLHNQTCCIKIENEEVTKVILKPFPRE